MKTASKRGEQQDTLSAVRRTTNSNQRLKDSIVNSIERLTQLEVHSTELLSVLEAKDILIARLERGASRPHKLALKLHKLEAEHAELSTLQGVQGEVLELSLKLTQADELKRFYEEKFAMMSMQLTSAGENLVALQTQQAVNQKLKLKHEQLRNKLALLFEEQGFVEKYVAKLNSDIYKHEVISIVNRRLITPTSTPTNRLNAGFSSKSVKSNPVSSDKSSTRLERPKVKQFVPSYLRTKRAVKPC